MSFQAYLDTIEKKTGLTPQQLLDEAATKGYGPQTKAGVVIDWLAVDHSLGRGHAMALYHVIKNGPTISEKHVGTDGTHRDESRELRLDGIAARNGDPASTARN
ncbi:DUF4287 domain-containing protein [Intrasporangium mesophilum]